ncbi:MAG: hypothetical protein QF404_04485 [Planctomycetota bacterium]|jgi:hypothetical protein|nr:hypothetical protein [Planctomycetota bacterium]MDP6939748.1 hypothetical protein [Planctomycetota bacterium]
MTDPSTTVIARAPIDDLRSLQRVLKGQKIASTLLRPDGEDGGG